LLRRRSILRACCSGCFFLLPALGNSIKLKLVEAIQDGDVRRLKGEYDSLIFSSPDCYMLASHCELLFFFDIMGAEGLVNSMKKKTREKLSDMNVDRMGLLQLAVHLGKLEVCRYFVEDLGFDVERGGSCDGACFSLR
jgi:hypothetical protein